MNRDDYSNPPPPADWKFSGWPFDIHREISVPGNYRNFEGDRHSELWAPFELRGYVLGVSLRRRQAIRGDGHEGDWTNLHVLFGSAPLETGEPSVLFHENAFGGMKALHRQRDGTCRYTRHMHFSTLSADGESNDAASEPEQTDAIISAWRRQEPITVRGSFFALGAEPTEAGRRSIFTGFDRRHTCPTGIIEEVRGADGAAPPPMLNPAALLFWRAVLRARSYVEHERFNWLRLTPQEQRTFPRSKTA